MTDVLKIALTGKLRSGKDEVAMRLYFSHGFAWPIAFGSKLKRTADALFPDYVKEGAKPRELYQRFGQLCRTIDEDVWVKHAAKSVEFALNQRSTRGIVISDLRQPNEYEWCKENGFVIVRVNADMETRLERARQAGDNFDEADLLHSTKQYVDSFEVDYEIHNDGSLDEMWAQVDSLIKSIGNSEPII